MLCRSISGMPAKLLSSSLADLSTAASHLRSGGLVSFPTETVYGLGANALDVDAVNKIFQAKGRPKTDPLICHFADIDSARKFLELDSPKVNHLFDVLGSKFWPGPLTIVAKAAAHIPEVIRAGGPNVGVRIPRHPVATELIRLSGLAIAAPSANRFGHVSPTTAEHVMEDLGFRDDLLVVDGGSTEVGIESTVLRIENESTLTILRRGGISQPRIEAELQLSGIQDVVVSSVDQHTKKMEAQAAPGQMITHYAPDVPTYILDTCADGTSVEDLSVPLNGCVCIDFGKTLKTCEGSALAYRDLSPAADAAEAASQLYGTLRWAEGVDNAKLIVIVDPTQGGDDSCREQHDSLAIYDRIYRAASGNRCRLNSETQAVEIATHYDKDC